MELPAPASLQPLPDLSLVPPADTPEAAFDMIAAANLQPEAPLEQDSTPDPETEELTAAADSQAASSKEPEANVDPVLPEDEAEEEEEEEESPLEEVHLHQCMFSQILCCSSFELPSRKTVELMFHQVYSPLKVPHTIVNTRGFFWKFPLFLRFFYDL